MPKGEIMNKNRLIIIISGAIMGAIAAALVLLGNPANMGFCIACFLRDVVGSLGLHQAGVVQYFRPEIVGIVLGAFILSVIRKDFIPKSGSAPFTRFILGFFVMVGALVFLGCPFRLVLRLAGGDLNAVVGLFGFVSGIGLGTFFLNKGYSLGRNIKQRGIEGYIFPAVFSAGLLIFLLAPALLKFSQKGPGAMHAPILISLAAGLIVGVLAQNSRSCMVGGIRDIILYKETSLLMGYIFVFVGALVVNIIANRFNLSFVDQPIAHTDHLWNFLSMGLVGYGSVLAGGCPMRQLILSAEGNTDSVITVLGLMVGAAFSHNFMLASSGKGVTSNGKIAVIIGFAILIIISLRNIRKEA